MPKKKKVTFEFPEEIAEIISKYPFVKNFIVDKVTKDLKRRMSILKKADTLLKSSELTEEDTLELEKIIKQGVMEKFK
ncbi:MAG: hypothetical protein ACP6IU_14175 [Candidatus Asgardarchaeia archaeon]